MAGKEEAVKFTGGGSTVDELTKKTTSKAKTTSTTATGFVMEAYNNGIRRAGLSKAPENLEEIRERYDAQRATASPTQSMYEAYVENVEGAPNEATIVQASSALLKRYPNEGYLHVYSQAFTGLPADVGFNNGLSPAQPDFVEGLTLPQYAPFPVYAEVDGAVVFKDNDQSLVLPHIAGEWKGPGKDLVNAKVQSSYDGASLVYGRQQALAYMDRSDPPGHASVTTFTTDGSILHVFSHHHQRAETEDGPTEYHQYPVKTTPLVDSYASFKEGYRTIRNAQDHARSLSRSLRDELKDQWMQQRKHRGELRARYESTQDAYRDRAGDQGDLSGTTVLSVDMETGGEDEEAQPGTLSKGYRGNKRTKGRGTKSGKNDKAAPGPTRRSSRLAGKKKM